MDRDDEGVRQSFVSARRLRFTALGGFGGDNTAAIAELAWLYTGAALPENSGGVTYQRVRSASSDIDENIVPAKAPETRRGD
jgi:beta-galactosidase